MLQCLTLELRRGTWEERTTKEGEMENKMYSYGEMRWETPEQDDSMEMGRSPEERGPGGPKATGPAS